MSEIVSAEIAPLRRILIVDDEPVNRTMIEDILTDQDYTVWSAVNGREAIEKAHEHHPDLILMDVMMPEMGGFEACQALSEDPAMKSTPVIFMTALSDKNKIVEGFKSGAVDYILKPFFVEELLARVDNHLRLREAQEFRERQNEILEAMVEKRTQELARTQEVTIQALSSLAEARDYETGQHIRRTQTYVRLLAEDLSDHPRFCEFLDEETIDMLYKSACLHDIGKVGVPDAILHKPGQLNEEEMAEMRRHTDYGRDAIQMAEDELGSSSFLRHAREIIHTHHERWDGSGYPRGLKGDEIPIEGRLMALADVYDALVTKRCYKPAFSHERAVDIILGESGKQFDPDVVNAFQRLEATFREVAEKYAD